MKRVRSAKKRYPREGSRHVIPAQVAANQQSAVVGKAIYVVGDVGYAAPTMADGQVRDSGTPVEVDAVPCALHPQTEVGFLVERRTDLQTFIDPVQIPEYWPPDREVATGCMIHITFAACCETDGHG